MKIICYSFILFALYYVTEWDNKHRLVPQNNNGTVVIRYLTNNNVELEEQVTLNNVQHGEYPYNAKKISGYKNIDEIKKSLTISGFAKTYVIDFYYESM